MRDLTVADLRRYIARPRPRARPAPAPLGRRIVRQIAALTASPTALPLVDVFRASG
jgi:hypothetical protein